MHTVLDSSGSRHLSRRENGFTLLEVMVALAILGMGLTLLLQAQARAVSLAQQAHGITVGTMLARAKMYDCEQDLLKKGFSIGDYNESGNFSDDDFPSFFWQCRAYKPDLPIPDGGDITSGVASAMSAQSGSAASGATPALPQGADMGLGLIAPVLSQVSQVLGDSIRELTVIVSWQEGEDWQTVNVTTHVVDKNPIAQIASGIQNASSAISGATGVNGAQNGQGVQGGQGGRGSGASGLNPGASVGGNRERVIP